MKPCNSPEQLYFIMFWTNKQDQVGEICEAEERGVHFSPGLGKGSGCQEKLWILGRALAVIRPTQLSLPRTWQRVSNPTSRARKQYLGCQFWAPLAPCRDTDLLGTAKFKTASQNLTVPGTGSLCGVLHLNPSHGTVHTLLVPLQPLNIQAEPEGTHKPKQTWSLGVATTCAKTQPALERGSVLL